MASKKRVLKKTMAPRGEHSSLRIDGSVARDMGIAIVGGQFRPGDLMEGEVEASERLRVSRTAYREAVRILAAKGLVEVRPKIGTRVNTPDHWHLLDPDVLSWIFGAEPDDKLVQALFALRKIIEPAAAALAAQHRSTTDLGEMAQALQGMSEHTLATDAGRAADQKFHASLLRATNNPFVASLTSGVGAAVSWTTIFKQRHKPLPRDPVPDHERVFQAIAAADPDAAREAMATLIDLALRDTTNSRRVRDKAAKV
jgi:DNA-binding FadR family transcriptional regulator